MGASATMHSAWRRSMLNVPFASCWPRCWWANRTHQRAHSATHSVIDREEFHRYTRLRFVCDEAHEVAQRYVPFNLEALAAVAAEAVGSARCISVEKLPDGNYNKTLLLTMDDGAQAVAKLPNPNAGRPHLTVASEVATMDFVREKLGMPVPKVHAWCSHADRTPVKAEYIIMEKAKGVLLSTMLPKMDIKKRWALARVVADYQMQWAETPFEAYGSLYYRADLPSVDARDCIPSIHRGSSPERFIIGPTTARTYNEHGKISLKCDLGPWTSALDYFKAIGERELISINQLDLSLRSPVSIFGPGVYEPNKSRKIRAAESFFDILPQLMPENPALLKPCLWHSDLHDENIFVSPDDPTEVTAIIDWQSIEIAPLISQAVKPPFVAHKGPQAIGLERPQLPSRFKSLPKNEQRRAQDLWLRQSLVVLYNTLVSQRSPKLWKAMDFQQTLEYQILSVANILLFEGEATCLKMILDFLESHEDILADEPLDFASRTRLRSLLSDQDIIRKDAGDAERAVELMEEVQTAMGESFPLHGQVSHVKYDETKEALRQIKEQIIGRFAQKEQDWIAWQRTWPFDD